MLYLLIFFILVVIVFILFDVISFKKSYFKNETNYSYYHLFKKGVRYEYKTYNYIRNKLGTNFPMLYSTLINKKNIDNEYTEIDLILFHHSGIYCLELKDYRGKIYGYEKSRNWKIIYKWKDKNKRNHTTYKLIYNPVKQNAGHIFHLKNIVDYKYKNYVLFSSRADLQQNGTNVLYVPEFIKLIKNTEPLPEEEYKNILSIYELVLKENKNTKENMKKHVKRLKSNKRLYQNK